MLKQYGRVATYIDEVKNLLMNSYGENDLGMVVNMDVVQRVNFPYEEKEFEDTLLKALELCHSKIEVPEVGVIPGLGN